MSRREGSFLFIVERLVEPSLLCKPSSNTPQRKVAKWRCKYALIMLSARFMRSVFRAFRLRNLKRPLPADPLEDPYQNDPPQGSRFTGVVVCPSTLMASQLDTHAIHSRGGLNAAEKTCWRMPIDIVCRTGE